MHLLLDRIDERGDVRGFAFSFQLDAPIGQVAHVARHVELPGDLQDGIAKAHALDMAGEKDVFVMCLCHLEKQPYVTRGDLQPAKQGPIALGGMEVCQVRILFAFRGDGLSVDLQPMSNFDSDGGSESQWEDRGELAWNEFDWERYLREQEEAIHRYLRFYEGCKSGSDRIDRVAEKMNWGQDDWSEESEGEEVAEDDEEELVNEVDDVYTLHKNPIFIATKAIYLSLDRGWQELAREPSKVPQPLAVALLASLHRGEEQAVHAIHALDFGDYAMAVSLFKRAMSALNGSLALLNNETIARHRHVAAWREHALARLFDLREIWLRVIAECREELNRPVDEE